MGCRQSAESPSPLPGRAALGPLQCQGQAERQVPGYSGWSRIKMEDRYISVYKQGCPQEAPVPSQAPVSGVRGISRARSPPSSRRGRNYSQLASADVPAALCWYQGLRRTMMTLWRARGPTGACSSPGTEGWEPLACLGHRKPRGSGGGRISLPTQLLPLQPSPKARVGGQQVEVLTSFLPSDDFNLARAAWVAGDPDSFCNWTVQVTGESRAGRGRAWPPLGAPRGQAAWLTTAPLLKPGPGL